MLRGSGAKLVALALVALALALVLLVAEGAKSASVAAALVAAGIAFVGVAFATIARELKEVAAATDRVLEDEAAPATVRAGDDVALLGRSVNRLTHKLSRSLRELAVERDRLASILDGMSEGVLVVDEKGDIVLANRALQALAQTTAPLVGRPVIEALRNVTLNDALDAAAKSDEPISREAEVGGIVPRRVLLRVARRGARANASSAPPMRIVVLHDVTDLRRLETIRTDFVANVSHELRTPIAAIASAAETLLGGALDEKADAVEFVSMIERQAKRLHQLVNDLLDLSKLESKGHRLDLRDADLAPILTHIVAMLEAPANAKRTKLTVITSEAVRAKIDRRALEQVVTNLVDNAIKYGGEGAKIDVAARRTGESVEISVADNGPGIPSQHLSRIFERFYRVDAGRSRDVGGTGLGLAIVKHLVELMHGRINVESNVGKGTRFIISLPAVK